jgi:hypothetical protein
MRTRIPAARMRKMWVRRTREGVSEAELTGSGVRVSAKSPPERRNQDRERRGENQLRVGESKSKAPLNEKSVEWATRKGIEKEQAVWLTACCACWYSLEVLRVCLACLCVIGRAVT